MKTMAQKINKMQSVDQIIDDAEGMDCQIAQDWEDEATIFRFKDDSFLVVSGSRVLTYSDFNGVLAYFPNAAI